MAIVCRGLAHNRTPIASFGLGIYPRDRGAGPPAIPYDDPDRARLVREDNELVELVMLLVTRVLR